MDKIIKINEMKPKYCTSCLLCDTILEMYDDPIPARPMICDECKEAVAFAKWLRTGRTNMEE